MKLIIDIPEEKLNIIKNKMYCGIYDSDLYKTIVNGKPLPKGHGRLKDEDEIVKAIEDRVEFLKKNDAVFMRLRKDIDILGCIPKIRCEVPTIIEADIESEDGE
jgi:hypothetical protein